VPTATPTSHFRDSHLCQPKKWCQGRSCWPCQEWRSLPVPSPYSYLPIYTPTASQCSQEHSPSDDITQALHLAITFIGPSLGFLPSDVSARYLHAAGATALFCCANVDSCHIPLLGRWHSADEMLRYLHLQAQPLMKDFSRKMLLGGAFTLIPNQLVPCYYPVYLPTSPFLPSFCIHMDHGGRCDPHNKGTHLLLGGMERSFLVNVHFPPTV
jgi:hypothetical protein